jgi:sugar-specific transcriptional regulator TrmB
MEIDKTLVSLFEQTGFSEKESAVYAALLLLGEADVTMIAKKADIKRTNAYPVLERLKVRGYVSETTNQKIRRFSPADPRKVFHQLENSAKMFKEMLPFLEAYSLKSGSRPRIQYFEGKDAVTLVFKDINHADSACFISSIAKLENIFRDEVRAWEHIYKSNSFKVTARALHTDTHADRAFVESISGPRYKAKFLPKGIDLKLDFSLYGDKIAISSVTAPPFVVVIQSEDLASSMRAIFDLLWASAGK